MQNNISRSKLESAIKSLKGKIFNVCWTKKSGELRCANVRCGVYTKTKGMGKGIANHSNSYVTVWLMHNQQGNTFYAESGYRVINLDTIEFISFNKLTYRVTPSAILEFHDTTVSAA
jgi:hypothetical protein